MDEIIKGFPWKGGSSMKINNSVLCIASISLISVQDYYHFYFFKIQELMQLTARTGCYLEMTVAHMWETRSFIDDTRPYLNRFRKVPQLLNLMSFFTDCVCLKQRTKDAVCEYVKMQKHF